MAQLKDLIVSGTARILNKLYASEFIGKLTGYADSAGNADTLDGKNASDFANASHSHNYAGSNSAGGNALTLQLSREGDDANWLPSGSTTQMRELNSGSYNIPYAAWWQILANRSFDTNYGSQLAMGMTTNDLYFRNYHESTWGSWRKVIFSDDTIPTANYASSAGSANSAVSVVDYADTSKTIEIGFSGAGATTSNLGYIAGYLSGGTQIKDVSKDTLKSWLGLGSAAYTNSDAYAASSHTHEIADVTGLQTALDGKGNYEEGTWTPTDSYAKVSSYSNCKYIKIGKLVYLSGYIVIEPNGSITGVVISGLPFAPLNEYNIISNIYTKGDNLHRYNSKETVETMRFAAYGATYFRIYDVKATTHSDLYLYMTYPKVNGTTIYLNVVYTIN